MVLHVWVGCVGVLGWWGTAVGFDCRQGRWGMVDGIQYQSWCPLGLVVGGHGGDGT